MAFETPRDYSDKPAGTQLYPVVREYMKQAIEELQRAGAAYSPDFDPATVANGFEFADNRFAVPLPILGSDELAFKDAHFQNVGDGRGRESYGWHDSIRLNVEPYSDGSPYIADGDDFAGPPLYSIFIDANVKAPARIIQAHQVAANHVTNWRSLPYKRLSNWSCRNIMDVLPQLPVTAQALRVDDEPPLVLVP